MTYYINPANLSAVFTVPCSVSDSHLKLSSALQLKVLLFFLRNMSGNTDSKAISEALGANLQEVEDALKYWTVLGILSSDEKSAEVSSKITSPTVIRSEKPSRSDVARRGSEDKKIMFLLREAQLKLGKNLKSNEASTLVWLYDDQGLDVSVILMIIQYAVSEGKANIGFIEKTAVDWINKGITTVIDAENELADMAKRKSAWNIVQSVFGIERRLPSSKEADFSNIWINEWAISRELLKKAYDICIDSKAKLSMPYINKILEGWHKDGIKSPDEIAQKEKTKKSDGKKGATYDIDLFEEMLNSGE